jgi:hypothetical protein
VTVLVGSVGEITSPAVHDTPLVGADLEIRRGAVTVPLASGFEHCVVVLDGSIDVEGEPVAPGTLAYLGTGRDELTVSTASSARLMVLGGTPFESPVVMWWNFVGRTRDEMTGAVAEWNAGAERFGDTGSTMSRIPAPVPAWSASMVPSSPPAPPARGSGRPP